MAHWEGSSWTVTSSPNTGSAQYNVLQSVACASSSDCWAIGNYITAGNVHQTLALHYTVSPVPIGVVSRKIHGSADTFDIDLPLTGAPGIECRSGGATGNHQVVITFATSVTVTDATVTPGSGGTAFIILAPGHEPPNEVVATLDNVSNAQTLTINLLGVNDATTIGDVHIPMSVLIGDTNGDGSVNSADISQTKSQSGQGVTSLNFREDVTVDGALNSADISLVKSKSGTALPAP
jgi:hypothetical protein